MAPFTRFRSHSASILALNITGFETPPDANEKAEFAFARLMFPGGWNDGYRGRFDGDWRQGFTLWTQDYPRADRHFSEAVRRLTRIHVAVRRAAG